MVGTASPPYRELSAAERADLLGRIRSAAPALLFAAFTMPRGERWVAEHAEALGGPVCVNVGAALDFAAGRVRRAPRWMQRLGLEWAYRTYREPARLAPRYARNALFLLRMVAEDLGRALRRGRGPAPRGRRAEPLGDAMNEPGIVVIGRNEGDRLRRCLASLGGHGPAVYVDSGSTDDSVALARSMGRRGRRAGPRRPVHRRAGPQRRGRAAAAAGAGDAVRPVRRR